MNDKEKKERRLTLSEERRDTKEKQQARGMQKRRGETKVPVIKDAMKNLAIDAARIRVRVWKKKKKRGR